MPVQGRFKLALSRNSGREIPMVRDPRGRFVRESPEERPHGYQRYYRGCRCAVCREGVRVHKAELRARKRGLTPVPPLVSAQTGTQAEPGPVVAAVRADVDRLGVRESQRALCAAAEAMARILDNPLLATTQPSACGKLMQIMTELHKSAAPQRGRLAVVQQMAPSSRPDAGA
jgi:hypothetical protein